MITKELREQAIREFNESIAREEAEEAAKEAAELAAKPKATVLPMPLDEAVRQAIVNRRHGVWGVIPHGGQTSYTQDDGPTGSEWDTMAKQPRISSNPHERYSQSLYGLVED